MEPSGHCPYLGLKQNRAIRFASPTPEHRCYVGGEAIDIPVDQANYCLSHNHIHCPLYTGSMLATTETQGADSVPVGEPSGLRGWLATLSPRDRAIYTLMVGTLGLIAAIYLFLGLQSLFAGQDRADQPPVSTSAAVVATAVPTQPASAVPSVNPPTPTALPTSPATPEPTVPPTMASVLFPPTEIATAVPPTLPPTNTPSDIAATPALASTGAATLQPSTVPPTALPTAAPTIQVPPTVPPTQPPVATSNEIVTLYFGDETGSLFVPVQRQARVENGQIARAAVNELIAGPQSGLMPLLLPATQVLDLRIEDGTAIVNFDRRPTGQGDVRGYYAVVYTLTQFSNIRQVQFQINGQNTGINSAGPVPRSVLNPLNPDSLPESTGATEFLPLYFPLNDGNHDVRIIRLVPRIRDTAQATLDALLEGPGSYGYAVQRVIPEGTQLRGVTIENATHVLDVNFSQEFSGATNRQAAVRNVVQSLTTLPNVRGVRLLVEGQPLADLWGEEYRNGFGKPLINPE